MTDKEYNKISQWTMVGGGLTPANQRAEDLLELSRKGDILEMIEVGARDLKFHRCYMSLLGYIYDYMPAKFKKAVRKNDFYIFLKHLKKYYEVKFSFSDGTQMIEYESISFGRMSEKRFKEYVKEQLPYIYENVVGKYYKGEIYDAIIANIENDYQKFFDKL